MLGGSGEVADSREPAAIRAAVSHSGIEPQRQGHTAQAARPSADGVEPSLGSELPQAHASEVLLAPQGSDVSDQLGELPPTVEAESEASGSVGQGSSKGVWHMLRSWLPVCVAPHQPPSHRGHSMFGRLSSRAPSRLMRSPASAPSVPHEVKTGSGLLRNRSSPTAGAGSLTAGPPSSSPMSRISFKRFLERKTSAPEKAEGGSVAGGARKGLSRFAAVSYNLDQSAPEQPLGVHAHPPRMSSPGTVPAAGPFGTLPSPVPAAGHTLPTHEEAPAALMSAKDQDQRAPGSPAHAGAAGLDIRPPASSDAKHSKSLLSGIEWFWDSAGSGPHTSRFSFLKRGRKHQAPPVGRAQSATSADTPTQLDTLSAAGGSRLAVASSTTSKHRQSARGTMLGALQGDTQDLSSLASPHPSVLSSSDYRQGLLCSAGGAFSTNSSTAVPGPSANAPSAGGPVPRPTTPTLPTASSMADSQSTVVSRMGSLVQVPGPQPLLSLTAPASPIPPNASLLQTASSSSPRKSALGMAVTVASMAPHASVLEGQSQTGLRSSMLQMGYTSTRDSRSSAGSRSTALGGPHSSTVAAALAVHSQLGTTPGQSSGLLARPLSSVSSRTPSISGAMQGAAGIRELSITSQRPSRQMSFYMRSELRAAAGGMSSSWLVPGAAGVQGAAAGGVGAGGGIAGGGASGAGVGGLGASAGSKGWLASSFRSLGSFFRRSDAATLGYHLGETGPQGLASGSLTNLAAGTPGMSLPSRSRSHTVSASGIGTLRYGGGVGLAPLSPGFHGRASQGARGLQYSSRAGWGGHPGEPSPSSGAFGRSSAVRSSSSRQHSEALVNRVMLSGGNSLTAGGAISAAGDDSDQALATLGRLSLHSRSLSLLAGGAAGGGSITGFGTGLPIVDEAGAVLHSPVDSPGLMGLDHMGHHPRLSGMGTDLIPEHQPPSPWAGLMTATTPEEGLSSGLLITEANPVPSLLGTTEETGTATGEAAAASPGQSVGLSGHGSMSAMAVLRRMRSLQFLRAPSDLGQPRTRQPPQVQQPPLMPGALYHSTQPVNQGGLGTAAGSSLGPTQSPFARVSHASGGAAMSRLGMSSSGTMPAQSHMRMLAQMQLQQQQQRRRNHHVLFVHPSLLVSPQPSQLSSTTAAAGAQQVAEATAGMSSATTPAYTTSEAAVPSAHVPPASPSQTGSQGPGSSISTLHPALQQVEGRAGEQPQDEQQHQGQVQVQQPGAAALGLVGRMMSLPVMKRQAWGLAAAQGQHRQQLSHRTAMPLNQQLLGLSAAAGTQPMQHAAPATRQLVLEQGNEAVFAPVALHGMAGLSLQDFDTLHVINQGYAADVHQAYSHLLESMVILKTYHLARLEASSWQHMRREVAILARCTTLPNVVRLWAAIQEGEHVVLVLEHCGAGDLHGILAKHGGRISERMCVRKVLAPLLTALQALHAAGIVHRDIKPSNVCYLMDGTMKLCDFGLAVDTTRERACSRIGTKGYMAPELLASSTPKDRQDPLAAGSAAVPSSSRQGGLGGKLTLPPAPPDEKGSVPANSQPPSGPATAPAPAEGHMQGTGAAASQGAGLPAAATTNSRVPSGTAIQWAKSVWHSLKKSGSSQSLSTSAAAAAAGGVSGAQRAAAGVDKQLSMLRGCSSMAGGAPGGNISAASVASTPLGSHALPSGASPPATNFHHPATTLPLASSVGLSHPEPSFALRQDITPAMSYSTTQAQGTAAEEGSVQGGQWQVDQGSGASGAPQEGQHQQQPSAGLHPGLPAGSGSPGILPPQEQAQQATSVAAPAAAALDVWSLGVTTYQCLVGRRPYSSDTVALMRSGGALAPPSFPSALNLSKGAKDFIRVALQQSPSARPSVAELLRHPWIVEHLQEEAPGEAPRTNHATELPDTQQEAGVGIGSDDAGAAGERVMQEALQQEEVIIHVDEGGEKREEKMDGK